MPAKVAAVLALILLAGCADSTEDPEETVDSVDPSDPVAARDAAGLVWSAGEPVTSTMTVDGSFAATDYCIGVDLPACFFDDQSNAQAIDITDLLPVGMPAKVTVVHTFQNDGMTLHDIGFSNGCGAFWYNSEGTPTAGPQVQGSDTIVFEVLMAPCFEDARTAVNVYPIITDPRAETAWSVEVSVRAEPDKALPGLPVVVPVEGNVTGFQATSESGSGSFLLWGPDDRFLGAFQAGDALAGNLSQGDHVLVVQQGSPPLRINLTGASQERAFDALGTFDWRPAGDAQDLNGAGPHTWEFPVDETALGVAIFISPQSPEVPPFGFQPAAYSTIQIDIASPAGTVYDATLQCAACLPVFGNDMWGQSVPGDPSMEAGTFTATLEYSGSAGLTAQAYSVHFQR